jgi:hypothetical protein
MRAPTEPASAPTSRPGAWFSTIELAYLLGEAHLGWLATADETRQPHVVPVGWSYNSGLGTIDITGRHFAATGTYRNVRANPGPPSLSTTSCRPSGPGAQWSGLRTNWTPNMVAVPK